jgi:hypothetical protein
MKLARLLTQNNSDFKDLTNRQERLAFPGLASKPDWVENQDESNHNS